MKAATIELVLTLSITLVLCIGTSTVDAYYLSFTPIISGKYFLYMKTVKKQYLINFIMKFMCYIKQ